LGRGQAARRSRMGPHASASRCPRRRSPRSRAICAGSGRLSRRSRTNASVVKADWNVSFSLPSAGPSQPRRAWTRRSHSSVRKGSTAACRSNKAGRAVNGQVRSVGWAQFGGCSWRGASGRAARAMRPRSAESRRGGHPGPADSIGRSKWGHLTPAVTVAPGDDKPLRETVVRTRVGDARAAGDRIVGADIRGRCHCSAFEGTWRPWPDSCFTPSVGTDRAGTRRRRGQAPSSQGCLA
jgi:hypothetical protein